MVCQAVADNRISALDFTDVSKTNIARPFDAIVVVIAEAVGIPLLKSDGISCVLAWVDADGTVVPEIVGTNCCCAVAAIHLPPEIPRHLSFCIAVVVVLIVIVVIVIVVFVGCVVIRALHREAVVPLRARIAINKQHIITFLEVKRGHGPAAAIVVVVVTGVIVVRRPAVVVLVAALVLPAVVARVAPVTIDVVHADPSVVTRFTSVTMNGTVRRQSLIKGFHAKIARVYSGTKPSGVQTDRHMCRNNKKIN